MKPNAALRPSKTKSFASGCPTSPDLAPALPSVSPRIHAFFPHLHSHPQREKEAKRETRRLRLLFSEIIPEVVPSSWPAPGPFLVESDILQLDGLARPAPEDARTEHERRAPRGRAAAALMQGARGRVRAGRARPLTARAVGAHLTPPGVQHSLRLCCRSRRKRSEPRPEGPRGATAERAPASAAGQERSGDDQEALIGQGLPHGA
jgi:hypothetical protein